MGTLIVLLGPTGVGKPDLSSEVAKMYGTSMISGGLRSDTGSVCWGMLYGVVTAAFLFFKMQAMATGPVSLTAFIGCASLLISNGFGVFVLGEGASVLQTVGVAILMIALFLVVSPKYDHA